MRINNTFFKPRPQHKITWHYSLIWKPKPKVCQHRIRSLPSTLRTPNEETKEKIYQKHCPTKPRLNQKIESNSTVEKLME